jgi:hypothetical protein
MKNRGKARQCYDFGGKSAFKQGQRYIIGKFISRECVRGKILRGVKIGLET